MPNILNVLQSTPWWVFALFALLMWLGFQALRPRALPIWRLLIVPAVFIGWGVTSLALQAVSTPMLIVGWSVAAVIGAAIGWTTTRLEGVRIDRARRSVSLPGSPLPLIRILLIFAAKYGLAIAVAIAPALRADLAVWDIAVSGAAAGYFLGWLARLASAYRRTTAQNLAAQAP